VLAVGGQSAHEAAVDPSIGSPASIRGADV
jgi:hypothetical protein